MRFGSGKGMLALLPFLLAGTAISAFALTTPQPAAAKAPATAKKPVAAPKAAVPARSRSVEISIPYPNAGMYLYRGIYGSFAGGGFFAEDSTQQGWEDALFQWQGEFSYFYTPWFSSGFGFKINAGETEAGQVVK